MQTAKIPPVGTDVLGGPWALNYIFGKIQKAECNYIDFIQSNTFIGLGPAEPRKRRRSLRMII